MVIFLGKFLRFLGPLGSRPSALGPLGPRLSTLDCQPSTIEFRFLAQSALGFRSSALGSRLSSLGPRLRALGSRHSAIGLRHSVIGSAISVLRSGLSILALGCWALGFRIWYLGFWALGSGFGCFRLISRCGVKPQGEHAFKLFCMNMHSLCFDATRSSAKKSTSCWKDRAASVTTRILSLCSRFLASGSWL